MSNYGTEEASIKTELQGKREVQDSEWRRQPHFSPVGSSRPPPEAFLLCADGDIGPVAPVGATSEGNEQQGASWSGVLSGKILCSHVNETKVVKVSEKELLG